MKKIICIVSTLALMLAFNPALAAGGFDEFGYNLKARNFVGTCVSWYNGKFGGTVEDAEAYCGIYSSDKLKMSWNAEWDRGNDEGWTDEYYGAWTDNQWNGMAPGGSGETWHYMIRWVGDCGSAGTPLPDGGYCIWSQFEVSMSHGTFGGEHFWDAHAVPSGYGGY